MDNWEEQVRELFNKQVWSDGDYATFLDLLETYAPADLQGPFREQFIENLSLKIPRDQQHAAGLLARIHEKLQLDLPRRRILPRRIYYWAAACILLLLGIGTYFWDHQVTSATPPSTPYAPVTDISPGASKAILTLADGRQMVLDSLHNGQVGRQGNASIQKEANGQLVYQTAGGDNTPVVYNTLTTPKGGEYMLTLPDGTKVWLNAASSIRYPTTFNGRQRHVELTGEAYFEVAQKKAQPFSVGAGDMNVQVLGTEFDIMAYAEEGNKKATLVQGAVKILSGKETRQLNIGEQAIVSEAGSLSVDPQVNVESVIAWKSGFFQFRDTDLKTIMRQIARWYDVDIVYHREGLSGKYGGRISRKLDLSELIGLMENNGDGHFKIEGRKLIVLP